MTDRSSHRFLFRPSVWVFFALAPSLFVLTGCDTADSTAESRNPKTSETPSAATAENPPTDSASPEKSRAKARKGERLEEAAFERFPDDEPERATGDLPAALELLDRISPIQPLTPAEEVFSQRNNESFVHHLNKWAEKHWPTAEWKPDPLINRVPSSLKGTPNLKSVDRRTFEIEDIDFLLTRRLERDIVNWATERARLKKFTPLIAPPAMGLEAGDRAKLKAALALLDWVVRNVQLDRDPRPEEDPRYAELANPQGASADFPPSARGLRGPGYTSPPMRSILFGHADGLARTWLFLELCRQVRVDGCLLTLDDGSGPRPWTAAVLVAGRVWPIDLRLGLPLPRGDQAEMASLDELLENPGWLRSLDIDATSPYPVTEAELKTVAAYICARGEELSARMQAIEADMAKNLPSERSLVLSVDASSVLDRIRKTKGMGQYGGLWRIPFDGTLFLGAIQGLPPQAIPPLDLMERAAFGMPDVQGNRTFFPLADGRLRHLKGKFELDVKDPLENVRDLYVTTRRIAVDARDRLPPRVENAEIESVVQKIDPNNLPASFGDVAALVRKIIPNIQPKEVEPLVRRLPNTKPEMLQTLLRLNADSQSGIAMGLATATRARENATIWLALATYENGRFPIAKEWLADRTLRDPAGSPWTDLARYGLSRIAETEGDSAAAAKWLEDDVASPSRQGNVVRARFLRSKNRVP